MIGVRQGWRRRTVMYLRNARAFSIGSFHSDNLADLIAISDADYEAPPLPFEFTSDCIDAPSLTSNSRRGDFLLDFDNWTFLNHGAFGAALKAGYSRANTWRYYLEKQPLRYFDRDLLPHLAHSTRALAKFVNASKSNVTLLNNVTSGLNAVLAGHAREYGESAHCILWDTSYGSVKKMAEHYYSNGSVSQVPFQEKFMSRLATHNDPEDTFLEALDDHLVAISEQIREKHVLLILDHTTSNTALTMPIAKLAAQMKEYWPEAIVVVDGAHGVLAQNLNLTNLFAQNVDIYLTNGHKWLSAPRGVAMMALSDTASQQYIDTILRRPAVISHGVDEPDLLSRYVYDGCRDYAAALSIPAVLDYWDGLDPARVRNQCKAKLRNGIQLLAAEWHGLSDTLSFPGPVTLAPIDSSLLSPMALVGLPSTFDSNQTSADAKTVQDYLYSCNIEVPVKCINQRLYVRVSCHIYNNTDDFVHLANVVKKRCQLNLIK